MKKQILTALCAAGLTLPMAHAENPKQEFRGAWIHTVHQSQYAKMTTDETKAYLCDQLDKLKAAGCNAGGSLAISHFSMSSHDTG